MKSKKMNTKRAENAFGRFLSALGFDWENDPNMQDTPRRVTKMYAKELFQGLQEQAPTPTAFPSDYQGIVFQGNIDIKSTCAHHFCPFIGKAHIAYIPNGKVIGLSKLNRIANHFARRPQLQEDLTKQIHDAISDVCEGNTGVAVYIEAKHTCVSMRGIQQDSTMKTVYTSGAFLDNTNLARNEFYGLISNLNK